jgi:hypothetical protein
MNYSFGEDQKRLRYDSIRGVRKENRVSTLYGNSYRMVSLSGEIACIRIQLFKTMYYRYIIPGMYINYGLRESTF